MVEFACLIYKDNGEFCDCVYFNTLYSNFSAVAAPFLSVDSTAVTSLSLSWTAGGSGNVSYDLVWFRVTLEGSDQERNKENVTITDGSTGYNVTGLEEGRKYEFTVTAGDATGSTGVSNTVSAMTGII